MAKVARRRQRYVTDTGHENTCPPRWAWLLAGIFIGIFISFLVYLREIAPQQTMLQHPPPPTLVSGETTPNTVVPPEVTAVKKEVEPATVASVDKQETTKSEGFTFHDLLSQAEVNLTQSSAATTQPQQALPISQQALPDTVTRAPAGTLFVLQVGSFRDLREADGLRAHLTLLGFQSYVEKASLAGGDVWHRVRLGPFRDIQQMNDMRAALQAQNVTTMVLKK